MVVQEPDGSFHERLARLEAREAIRDLCSRYVIALDSRDFSALADLFAARARFGTIDEPRLTEGRHAVICLLRERTQAAGPSFHANHDMVVDLDDANVRRATGVVTSHAEVSPHGKHLVGAIRYHDVYVVEDGRWRFAERRLAFLYFTPIEDYRGILAQRKRLRAQSPPQEAHWPLPRAESDLP